MHKKKTTIKDIAEMAKVTPATVSMALNNHPRIRKKTRDMIRDIAQQISYQPNYAARSLVNNKSFALGVTLPRVTDSFYAELLQGIEDKAFDLGYSIIQSSTKNDSDKERLSINLLRSRGVDGLVVASTQNEDPTIEELIEDEYPLVLVNRVLKKQPHCDRVDFVTYDNFTGVSLAMDHLCQLGHTRIGVICGLQNTSTGQERKEGVIHYLRQAGLPIDQKLFVSGSWDKQTAYQATQKLLQQKPRPSAIFSTSDEMALMAREAILDVGLEIPSDIALMGFDNIRPTSYRGIEISTVGLKIYEMSQLAAETLIAKIENTNLSMIKRITLKPELIIRQSCGFKRTGYHRQPESRIA